MLDEGDQDLIDRLWELVPDSAMRSAVAETLSVLLRHFDDSAFEDLYDQRAGLNPAQQLSLLNSLSRRPYAEFETSDEKPSEPPVSGRRKKRNPAR